MEDDNFRFGSGDCSLLSFEGMYVMKDDIDRNYLNGTMQTMVVTFLREPVQHFLSRVLHDKRAGRVKDVAGFLKLKGEEYGARMKTVLAGASNSLVSAHENLHGLFFIGLTEYYALSLCLLAWQLGDFVSDQHLALYCTCPSIVKPYNTAPSQMERHTYTSVSEIKVIAEASADDTFMYMQATRIFWARVDAMRLDLQRDLACLAGMPPGHI